MAGVCPPWDGRRCLEEGKGRCQSCGEVGRRRRRMKKRVRRGMREEMKKGVRRRRKGVREEVEEEDEKGDEEGGEEGGDGGDEEGDGEGNEGLQEVSGMAGTNTGNMQPPAPQPPSTAAP